MSAIQAMVIAEGMGPAAAALTRASASRRRRRRLVRAQQRETITPRPRRLVLVQETTDFASGLLPLITGRPTETRAIVGATGTVTAIADRTAIEPRLAQPTRR